MIRIILTGGGTGGHLFPLVAVARKIFELSKSIVEFLLQKRAKILVVACNTITVYALNKLRSEFDEVAIVGTVPVVKTASEITRNGKIGIFSTKKTAESQYQKDLINKFASHLEVLNTGSNEIAPKIEKGEDELEYLLENELQPFKEFGADVLVLGCTHYPLIKDKIQAFMGTNIKVIDSGPAITRQVKRILEKNNALSNSENPIYTFYTSGELGHMASALERLSFKGKVLSYG